MSPDRYGSAARRCWAHFANVARRCLTEEDKRLHAKWSFWLTLGAYAFWPPLWAVTVVFIVGLGKECWDEVYGTGFCLLDMVSNLAGIVAGSAICTLVIHRATG